MEKSMLLNVKDGKSSSSMKKKRKLAESEARLELDSDLTGSESGYLKPRMDHLTCFFSVFL